MLLPIDAHDGIDWPALVDLVQALIGSGVDGLYTCGTAGEFHAQTEAEFDRISELVANESQRAGMPFQIGISNSNPRVARARLQRVRALCPDAVQFTLPDWWCLSPSELTAFASGLEEAGEGRPLVLYNPPHAKQRLSLEEIAGLRAAAPSLIGAKLPGGDADWYRERRRLLPDFSVFVPGHTVAFGRPLGADGAYSNVACLSPAGALRHWRMIETDPEGASELEARIQVFMQQHVVTLQEQQGLSNAALDKLMAAAGGWAPLGPGLLWPYRGASAADVANVARAARQQLPELF